MDRAHRLSSSREFRRVLGSGVRGSSGSVTCVALRVEPDAPGRVGVTATKRVGGSVLRNRVKRRLREAVGPCLDSMHGAEVVLIAKPETARVTFESLQRDVAAALRKAGVPC